MKEKYVYNFDEGNKFMVNTLGGKGANLSEMRKLGIPVPSGFTVTTNACCNYYENDEVISDDIISEIFENLKILEDKTGKKFGSFENPLLLSVRSGSRASMPGMMDTILNLGLNDDVVKSIAVDTNRSSFIYDSYRRFIQMYADVVMGQDRGDYEKIFENFKISKNYNDIKNFNNDDFECVIKLYKAQFEKNSGEEFPSDPMVQLINAIKAVFKSWNTSRAVTYRRLNCIPSNWYTAANVQEMVFGNLNESSGTGVAFTRNPSTGENKIFGEYLINAQGEDVVAGISTPESIEKLKEVMPSCYLEFEKICSILENHYKDMQDMEFTIENNKLYILQTRNGKRTAHAALAIAYDLVNENMITKKEALLKVDAMSLDQLLHPGFLPSSLKKELVIGSGLAASPGAGTGKICFSADEIVARKNSGEDNLILVRLETSPEDIEGMVLANAVVTLRGGMTSHAAVVARGMGICCVSGCDGFTIDESLKILKNLKNGKTYGTDDIISVDGSSGLIYEGELELSDNVHSPIFDEFISWADSERILKIRANADNKKDATVARDFGAEGIGLCRTEHMFFKEDRIFDFRKMIMSKTTLEREAAIEKILPYQLTDFEDLFEVMNGYGVTIRYLDPPFHEFLPKDKADIEKLALDMGITYDDAISRIESLKEFNPMMGHRGVRLAITYPEIAIMQTKAVITAAINCVKKGLDVNLEIMVPLIGEIREFDYLHELICSTANELISSSGVNVKYQVGTMIEIPRACVIADQIAENAEFFSFGTNDLTQLTYGFSRDDASKFLDVYYKKQIMEIDPFATIDQEGVGEFMKIATEKARITRPNIKLGICGEHGGEVKSIEFCNKLGLTYVSCSAYRVPIAKLAAAQAKILSEL